ncbi:MAG: hypothetical protein EHM72_02445, partial [Calditrichaeota bacterium]
MNEMPSLPGAEKVSSFISKKEKAWGNFGVLLILAFLVIVFYLLAPFLITWLNLAITVVGKTIVLGVLVGLAAILWFLFTSKRFRAILWYWRAKFYRKFTLLMIKTGPMD